MQKNNMAEKWTANQLKAITSFGHNILVSAGAGSGKTAVLSERVYRHVGERNIDINNLLVLTFTNKAAAEMKGRIREKIINDELKLFKDDAYKNKQINKIDSAFIMTFDAYALYLVKKYHYLLNIDKNINIIDNNILTINNKKYLEEILLEEYQKQDETFVELINKYCIKNDDLIMDAILQIDDGLQMMYEKDKYISSYEERFYSEDSLNNLLDEYTKLLINKILQIRQLENKLAFDVEDTKEYYINLDNLYTCKTYDQILKCVNEVIITDKKLPRGSGELVSETKKNINELIKELKEEVVDRKFIFDEILDSKKYCLYLLKLAEKLNDRNSEYKKRNNLYSFIDVFKMAIELVDKHEDIRQEISSGFKEILIDEYQDTNDLQDEFIKKVQRDNVYMVGDIKQSIYRFRNANPDLFKEKYDLYSTSDSGELIELEHNFRSKKQVLDGVNLVFDRVMDREIGGADYKEAHHMISGRSDKDIDDQNNDLEILNYGYDPKMEEFSLISKQEFEAFVLAKDINDKVGKFEVNDNGVIRKAMYKDFCIIVDRTKNFDLYKQILMYFNIPSIIEADNRISDSDLISVIRALFKLLNCVNKNDYSYDFKYAFVSLARSFLFEMGDSKIYEMVKNEKYDDSEILSIIRKISIDIESKTISEILDEMILETDLYTKLYKIKDVSNNLVKIDYLYQLAHTFNSMNYDYEGFDEYLRRVFEEELDIRYATDKSQEDAVKIINIHKAKGLEYKICYYVGMDVKFNRSDLNKRIIFFKQLGIILPTYIENKGLKDTIKKQLYTHYFDKEDISEKIRLLYVALTRAQDKMIIVASLENNTCDGEIVADYERLEYNNFKKIFDSIYDDISNNVVELSFDDYILNNDYLTSKKKKPSIKKTNETINIKPHIIINPEPIKEDSYSKQAGLIDEDMIRAMDFGSKLHYYFELLDFNNPDYSYIEDEYKNMIEAFMKSDLMKNSKDGKAYKEYEFMYGDVEKKHGFIDLLMEYDDRFEIIDYKTKNIDDIHYDEQLNGYRNYLETITDKRIDCYLYSIVDGIYRKVEKE